MKVLKAILVVLFFGVLSWNTKLTLEISDLQVIHRDALSPDTGILIKEVRNVGNLGNQQRTILMQRVLGLEHAHQMHPESNIPMCPGCAQGNKQEPGQVVKK